MHCVIPALTIGVMLPFSSQLHTLIASPYPYLYLVTYEEERVNAVLRSLAQAMGRPITRWEPESHADPGAALDAWIDTLSTDANKAIAVAVDVHPYLADPQRVRRFRVAQGKLMARGTTVVFISPVAVTPRELEKDWVLVDVPLPDREELANVLDAVAPEEAGRSFERDRLAGAALGLTRRESLRAFRRAQHVAELNNALGRGTDWESVVIAEKRRLMSAATALEFCEPGANLDDIGGLDTLKRWVHERRAAFSDDARQFGLPQPKGLMLVGVQGCGKSLAAKAVAGFWGIPLVRLDLGALFSGSVAPDDALREAIRSTEAMAPCVLWVDEIEKGFSEGDAETSRVLGSLLVWLQEKQSAVFLVATANQVDKLPPELLRRGRFDELFFVDLPDQHARRQILAIHLGRRGRSGFDVDELAGKTQNFSGAELEQVVIAAMYRAFADDREVSQADLTLAAKQLIPLYKLRETDVKALRTWAHERARPAGHDRKLSDLFDG